MKNILKLSLLVFFIFLLKGCSDDDNPKEDLQSKKRAFVINYVNIVEASYNDALAKTEDLKKAIDNFVANPTEARFSAAKKAWLASREPYGQTEAYRFYDGPIDGDGGEPEGYINAWPLDEALIDYVADGSGGQQPGDKRQNIINNVSQYPTLTKNGIKEITGYNDKEENVTIGYHAIEFLLWGQDLEAPSAKTSGNRKYTDYTTAKNADRRKQYLKFAAEILVEDLASVVNQWKQNAQYRKTFLALNSDEAIAKILTGAAKLSKGELAGERMVTAVKKQDQEDEHSCFSDNTHRDIYLNAMSINNIINGVYKKLDGTTIKGTSLLDVLKEVNPTEASKLEATSKLVMKKVKVIADTKYFDSQIMSETVDNDSKPVMSAVGSLETQGDELAQAGKTITNKDIDPSV